MIDAIQLPILLKAIDFIFDEGRRILEERRQRRNVNENAVETETAKSADAIAPQDPIIITESKQELVNSKIDEIQWKNHEAEVSHLVRLLETFSNNYRLAREQYAKWGAALVPPIIINNMVEAENAVIETTTKLELLLAKIYKKENPTTK
jgi:hypothetical protein